MPEVMITSREQTIFGDQSMEDAGEIFSENQVTVIPQHYAVINVREQRIYTLANSLGFVGGISGLFVAIHALLFGNRPGSPWGLVQQFSIRLTQNSLYSALKKSYNTIGTRIPFVSPIHPRFGEHSTNDNNINASEETVKLNIEIPSNDEDALTPHQYTCNNKHQEVNGRVERMEERIQLIETMLKSYYIDDTLFKSLERAVDQSPK